MAKYQKLKIVSVLGTRPELIRLCRVLPMMDQFFNHIFVYTNQSYSPELSDVFFKDFDLRQPDYLLNVKSDTLGGQIANILSQTEQVFLKEQPDGLLVLGDTNSALCTIVARRLKIPIFHMEAGNRSFDPDVPEETNRKIVDHISDYNLAYTEHARRYLIQEGIHPGTIYVTGSPLAEAFDFYQQKIDSSDILKKLKLSPHQYFVVSTHREENIDNPKRLQELFNSFNTIATTYKLPIIVSLHPRTKNKLPAVKKLHPLVKLETPFGFFDYVNLEKNSLCTISDSGTIPEESAMLNFNAIQIRVSSERPEAFDTGSIILTGVNANAILNSIDLVLSQEKAGLKTTIPTAYQEKNVSLIVAKLILGLASIKKYSSS